MLHKPMPLSAITPYLPAMHRKGVSVVARSKRGFLTAYRRAGGRVSRLSPYWRNRRENFIKRHMAQARKNGERIFVRGQPSRRALALIAWAYKPGR